MSSVSRMWRRAAKVPLDALLRFGPLRTRLAFELRQHYFQDLDCNVPLGHGLTCPAYSWDALSSFGHIFLHNEYGRAFDRIPLPQRWVDIGCYAGYFSLFTTWLRLQRGLSAAVEALLIDADSRSPGAVNRLIELNRLQGRFRFLPGLIWRETGVHNFVERAFQTSSVATDRPMSGVVRQVSTLAPGQILEALPPPYDLIKVDIEGGEYDLALGYAEVLRSARHLILEWHSWHPGGGGEAQLRGLFEGLGFRFVDHLVRPEEEEHRQKERLSGVHLYSRP
jgi:FkbM family methyltransferase